MPGIWCSGLPRWLRLGIDAIDLYQLHQDDLETPLDETLHALDLLVQQG